MFKSQAGALITILSENIFTEEVHAEPTPRTLQHGADEFESISSQPSTDTTTTLHKTIAKIKALPKESSLKAEDGLVEISGYKIINSNNLQNMFQRWLCKYCRKMCCISVFQDNKHRYGLYEVLVLKCTHCETIQGRFPTSTQLTENTWGGNMIDVNLRSIMATKWSGRNAMLLIVQLTTMGVLGLWRVK